MRKEYSCTGDARPLFLGFQIDRCRNEYPTLNTFGLHAGFLGSSGALHGIRFCPSFFGRSIPANGRCYFRKRQAHLRKREHFLYSCDSQRRFAAGVGASESRRIFCAARKRVLFSRLPAVPMPIVKFVLKARRKWARRELFRLPELGIVRGG